MKCLIWCLCLVLLLPMVSLAATQVGSQDGTVYTIAANGSNPVWSASLSKSVNLEYFPGPSGVSFIAKTAHSSGDKVYCSGGSITKIYYYNGTNAPDVEPPATSNATADFTGWTAL